jgi:diamine N-acetyltransferase
MILQGETIFLRALEPTDLDFLYQLENDESVWEVSNTNTPYSRFVLKQYLENAHKDIYEAKQVRLVICSLDTQRPLGFVDLFDFDPKHNRVGVGIVVFNLVDRNKGFAQQSLELLCKYAFEHLNVHQLYANITEDNTASIHLFEKVGFVKAGIKKDWIFSGEAYKNELIYQYFNEKT